MAATISRLGRRAVAIVRYTGPRGLWFAVLGELGYRRLAIRECLLDKPFPDTPAKIPLQLELLNDTQIDEYVAFRPGSDRDSIVRRLAANNSCFVARHNGKIISARWAATGIAQCDYLFRGYPLAADEAYLYDAFTAPEWRGKGVFPALTSEMHRYYRAADVRRSLCFTGPENYPAMIADTGYRRVGITGYVGIGRFRRHFSRMQTGERAPGVRESDLSTWNRSIKALDTRGHYLDSFLAEIKRNAYLSLIERWGGLPSKGRILKTDLFEEAMGPDAFLAELTGSQRLVMGMDLSWEATERARQRDTQHAARYLLSDARHLPFASESLSLIVSPSTLDHFADARDLNASLRELCRVLEPGGRLIITLDNRQNIFDPVLRLANRLGMIPFFLGRSYTVKQLRRELAAAGMTVIETTAIVHHPRMTAVASVALAKRLGSASFTRMFHSAFLSMQRLERTRLRYYSGCFVAALATPSDDRAVR